MVAGVGFDFGDGEPIRCLAHAVFDAGIDFAQFQKLGGADGLYPALVAQLNHLGGYAVLAVGFQHFFDALFAQIYIGGQGCAALGNGSLHYVAGDDAQDAGTQAACAVVGYDFVNIARVGQVFGFASGEAFVRYLKHFDLAGIPGGTLA